MVCSGRESFTWYRPCIVFCTQDIHHMSVVRTILRISRLSPWTYGNPVHFQFCLISFIGHSSYSVLRSLLYLSAHCFLWSLFRITIPFHGCWNMFQLMILHFLNTEHLYWMVCSIANNACLHLCRVVRTEQNVSIVVCVNFLHTCLVRNPSD